MKLSKTARCGPLANLFFAIINLEMSVQEKKRDWFDLGAMAYRQACPGIYAAATYVCPICRKPFTVEALDDGRPSKEHVPPQSVGGHELLLTCKECNNTAGTKFDADAKTKGVPAMSTDFQTQARSHVCKPQANMGHPRIENEYSFPRYTRREKWATRPK